MTTNVDHLDVRAALGDPDAQPSLNPPPEPPKPEREDRGDD